MLVNNEVSNMDITYMTMAIILGNNSKSIRRKIGTLIVDYSNTIPHIVADGINGTESGKSNICEDINTGGTLPNVIHSEINALNKLDTTNSNLALYVSTKPCINCTHKIINSNMIKSVFYCFDYSEIDDGVNKIFEDNDIKLTMIPFNVINNNMCIDKTEINFSGEMRKLGHSNLAINSMVADKLSLINN